MERRKELTIRALAEQGMDLLRRVNADPAAVLMP
jgi:hypothetical protein